MYLLNCLCLSSPAVPVVNRFLMYDLIEESILVCDKYNQIAYFIITLSTSLRVKSKGQLKKNNSVI